MAVVAAELASGGAGGPLAAESLANVLTVHLFRHLSAPRRFQRGRDGVLPRGRLNAVVEYIEEHLHACPSLAQMAAVVDVSSGIGLATAKRFVKEGSYVIITGRGEPELAAAVKEIGQNSRRL
jgi:hypothetical protein